MTRTLTFVTALLFAALIGSLIIGFAALAPAVLVAGLLCALPLFMLSLGAVLGRISNELMITRKDRAQQTVSRATRVNPRASAAAPEHFG